jgi:hypothetical protein
MPLHCPPRLRVLAARAPGSTVEVDVEMKPVEAR